LSYNNFSGILDTNFTVNDKLSTLLLNNNTLEGPIPLSFIALNLTRCDLGQGICSLNGFTPTNCGQFPLCYPPLLEPPPLEPPTLPTPPTEAVIPQPPGSDSSSAIVDITTIMVLLAIVLSVLISSVIVTLLVKYSKKKPGFRNQISPGNEEVIKALITPIMPHEDTRFNSWNASESFSSVRY
jgi:hypothetical protein